MIPLLLLGSALHAIDEDIRQAASAATTGFASRFLYEGKSSTSEREEGLGDLPLRAGHALVDREEGSAGLDNPRAGAGRTSEGRANFHPTVKPVDLMRYLIRLVTPPGATVLDPFCGSGTTGVAAVHEGVRFIGIELDTAHATIAWRRIENARSEIAGLALAPVTEQPAPARRKKGPKPR